MEHIDHAKLLEITRDKANKNVACNTCSVTMHQFFLSVLNLHEYVKTAFTRYELALWVKSNETFRARKAMNINYRTYKPRQRVLVELGSNIGQELSYEHYCVVLKDEARKLFVVPCSTSVLKHKASYDENGDLKNLYLKGTQADGFTKDTAILLMEARWISKARVLKAEPDLVDKPLYDQIYDRAFELAFPSRWSLLNRTQGKLEIASQELSSATERLRQMEDELNLLNQTVEELGHKYSQKCKEYDALLDELDRQTAPGISAEK